MQSEELGCPGKLDEAMGSWARRAVPAGLAHRLSPVNFPAGQLVGLEEQPPGCLTSAPHLRLGGGRSSPRPTGS